MKIIYTTILLLLSGCMSAYVAPVLQIADVMADQVTATKEPCMQIGDNNTCDAPQYQNVGKPKCVNGEDENGACISLICKYNPLDGIRHCSQSMDENGNPGPEYVGGGK